MESVLKGDDKEKTRKTRGPKVEEQLYEDAKRRWEALEEKVREKNQREEKGQWVRPQGESEKYAA